MSEELGLRLEKFNLEDGDGEVRGGVWEDIGLVG